MSLRHLKNQAFQSRWSSILKFFLSSLECHFRCLLGPFWRPLGGMLGPLGGLLAAIWGLLGASWRCLGNVSRDFWGLLGRQGAQEASKIPQTPPQRPPRGPPEAPRRPPRGPPEAPRNAPRPPQSSKDLDMSKGAANRPHAFCYSSTWTSRNARSD